MRYDLIDFRVFANIAEESNLTRGAARSYLSVPAASQRIKNLEETLGVKLLKRNTQGVELTEAGEIYLAHARIIFAQMERLTSDLQQLGAGISGQLKILANTTAISEFLPPVLGEYLPQHPQVNIDLRERLSGEAAKAVRDGGADLCLISGDVSTDGLECLSLLCSRLVAIVPTHHPLIHRATVSFNEILDQGFVGLLEGYVTQEFLRQQALRLHREMKVKVQVAGFEAAFRMVEAGAGISIIPEVLLARLNQRGSVGVCTLSDSWATREYQACARSFASLPRFAQEFVEVLQRQVRKFQAISPDAGSKA